MIIYHCFRPVNAIISHRDRSIVKILIKYNIASYKKQLKNQVRIDIIGILRQSAISFKIYNGIDGVFEFLV